MNGSFSTAGSRKRTVGPGEIIETGLLWTHDRKIRKSGKKLIQGCTPGNRSRGRQRRGWMDDIVVWTGLAINEAAGSTEDRDHWRGIPRAANRSSGGRHWTTTTTMGGKRWHCLQMPDQRGAPDSRTRFLKQYHTSEFLINIRYR